MPKWTDYTIKTNPADEDEVMVLDTVGKANKRLGLSALSNWIIGKIASKVFENLQTQNKTILGAINELNSKTNYLSPTSDSLTKPTTDGFTIGQWSATAEKSGNTVTLNFNIAGKMEAMSDIILFTTLPKKYSPANNHYHSYCTQEGNLMLMIIYTDGRLMLFNGNKPISGFFLRQTISYPVP